MINKIFLYELNMIIKNKIYLILFLITGVHSYFVLTTHTILGKNFTAPFSNISFMDYLIQVSPILILMIIFYISKLFSKKQQDINILLNTCQISKKTLRNIRIIAIITAYMVQVILIMISSFIFYYLFFSYDNYLIFIAITLIFSVVVFIITSLLTMLFGKYLIKFSKS